jgi:hypothetical protein
MLHYVSSLESSWSAHCISCLYFMSVNWVPELVLVQNHSKQTICSSIKGKKGSIYNRVRTEGSNSSDRGYYSFCTADTIPGMFHPSVCIMYCCTAFSSFVSSLKWQCALWYLIFIIDVVRLTALHGPCLQHVWARFQISNCFQNL